MPAAPEYCIHRRDDIRVLKAPVDSQGDLGPPLALTIAVAWNWPLPLPLMLTWASRHILIGPIFETYLMIDKFSGLQSKPASFGFGHQLPSVNITSPQDTSSYLARPVLSLSGDSHPFLQPVIAMPVSECPDPNSRPPELHCNAHCALLVSQGVQSCDTSSHTL